MDAAATSGRWLEPRRGRLRLPERLPGLKGKWLAAYSILWAVMLPLALIGAARGGSIVLATPTLWTPYGFATSEDANGIRIDSVLQPARRGGLKAGDYVVRIDGWNVPRTAARAAARVHVFKADGAATSFTVRHADGRTSTVRLIRSMAFETQRFSDAGVSRSLALAVNYASVVFVPLLFVCAATLLFIRRRREAVPALLSLSFLSFAPIVNSADLLGLSIFLVNLIGGVATILLFCALFAFPAGRFVPRWTAIAFFLLPLMLLVPPSSTVAGPLLGAGIAMLVLAALISRYRTTPPGAERLQLRWAFFGLVAGTILFAITIGAQSLSSLRQAQDPRWLVWEYAIINPLTALTFVCMTLGLIVSILRYRLYDADSVIGRSAAYGVLTIGFVALFAASQKIIELLGQEYLGQNVGGLAGGIGAALAAVAIAPMHARAQRWAERRFQRGLFRLRYGLPQLVGDLRETSGLEQIAGATLDSLIAGVRTSRAALIAGEALIEARGATPAEVESWWRRWTPTEHDGIDADEADPMFPVRVPLEAEGHGRVGWLLLGSRPDGSLFGKSERDAIEEVAEPVARAVQVVLMRQQREAELDQRLAALEQQIARVVRRSRPSAA